MILQSINEKSIELVKKYREKIDARNSSKQAAKRKDFFLAVLKEAKEDVILKRNHFENVTEDKLLECCIIELTAAESRLNYYLSLAKREKMINDEYLDALLFPEKSERGIAL